MLCRVIAWEPVPLFRDFFKFGIAVNGFQQLITVGTSQRPERMHCTIARLHEPGTFVALATCKRATAMPCSASHPFVRGGAAAAVQCVLG